MTEIGGVYIESNSYLLKLIDWKTYGEEVIVIVSFLFIFAFICNQGVMDEVISDNYHLVKSLKAGDEAAFKAVYLAYSGSLRNYAAVILQDAEKAYEVVQDIYVAVWTNHRNLDETKPLKNYLLRAVHNNALRLLKLDLARKLREEKVMAEILKSWEECEEPVKEKELLMAAIERLPEQGRKVLMMTYWENKKSADVAEELSISVRTVETILYKVKKKLREEIKK